MNAGFSLGGALAGLTFVVLGVLFFLDGTDVIQLQLDLLLPIVVIVLGVAVVASAAWPQGRGSS